jgi:cell division protein FtsA
VARTLLASIIEPRMEEIFTLCRRELELSPYRQHINGGCVITGGGVQIEGAARLAERTLGMPVKLGYPRGVGGLTDLIASPAFATAVGLLRQATAEPRVRQEEGPMFQRVRNRISDFLREYM